MSMFACFIRSGSIAAIFAIAVFLGSAATAVQESGDQIQLTPEQTEIKKLTEQFVVAFNNGDAKTIASRWAENGEMNLDGEIISGRDAIEANFANFFTENPGLQISIHIESIKLLGPTAAIETGISEVVSDEDDSVVDTYTLVYAKNNNQWQIVRSEVQQTEVDAFDWKQELGMLVGDWTSGDGDWRVETKFEWAPGGNFLKRTFEVFEGDQSVDAGIQIIGWDAVAGTVKSWMFHQGGGNGTGTWTRDDNQWVIECESTTAEGQAISSTNIFTILSDNDLRWQSTKRTVAGSAVEDTDSIRIQRVNLESKR